MLRSQADLQKLSEPFGTQSTSDFSFKKKKEEKHPWSANESHTDALFQNNLLID